MKLTKTQEEQIIVEFAAKKSKKALASKYHCSPWKIRAVVSSQPPRYHCDVCNKGLHGVNTRFCSKQCYYQQKRKYKNCLSCNTPLKSEHQKKYCAQCSCNLTEQTQKEVLYNRRCRLLSLAGNCCQKCGYNKCKDALHFHHIDKTSKEFQLSGSYLNKAWDLLLEELKKCVLLCANCHIETEYNLRQQEVPPLIHDKSPPMS